MMFKLVSPVQFWIFGYRRPTSLLSVC